MHGFTIKITTNGFRMCEGKAFEILSQNHMQESISSSPAISGGRIYIRTFAALYAIGK